MVNQSKRLGGAVIVAMALCSIGSARGGGKDDHFLGDARENGLRMIREGERIFRFDAFGDEAFWGVLGLPQVASTLTPRTALELGLKVDSDALPPETVEAIREGRVDLDDPAVTQALLRANAVLGVVGTFDDKGTLSSVGLTCALCHSVVDDSVIPSVGSRVDGLANRDLIVGGIIAALPNLAPVVELLRIVDPTIDEETVRMVLRSWGPGKFDAELFLDGQAFQPDGRSAATLIPNARGLAGFNLHTWTGGWGTVSYWNAFVAVLELHGVGTFFDERLDNSEQFPIAAVAGFGHMSVAPDDDQVTAKLPALQFYQLALPAVRPRSGVDFDAEAAKRGDDLFSGKAQCNNCHREPLWTEPGWNAHKAEELRIDDFEANRSPDRSYKTMNLAGIFVRELGLFMKPENRGRFYHDGRFQTLRDVVDSYNERFALKLTDAQSNDLVEYLKSL